MLLNAAETVIPDWSNPILHKQVGWWLARERSGRTLNNILLPKRFKGTLQAGAGWAYRKSGPAIAFNGGATAYVDLGTVPLMNGTDPFTLAWLEQPGATPATYEGVFTFLPSGAAQRFFVLHTDTDVNYKFLACGQGSAVSTTLWASAPSMASGKGKFRLWVLRGFTGLSSTTHINFDLRCDGVYLGAGAPAGAFTAAAANFNYIGWDGADSNFSGSIANVRLWNRFLSYTELVQLNLNPFIGLPRHRLFRSGAVAVFNQMFLAM